MSAQERKQKNKYRVPISQVFKKGFANKWLEGPDTWMKLGDGVLSKQGKELVSEDPDLSKETLHRLSLLQHCELADIPFTFDIDKDNQTGNDIGLALLSSCIKDNPTATWAEITARYSAIRRYPFLETAIALKALAKEEGLFYYAEGTKIPTPWHPRKCRFELRNISRKTSIATEWDLLSMESGIDI